MTTERRCACGGIYLDTPRGGDWSRHCRTRQHLDHEARFTDAGLMPVNEPAVFRGYPR